MDLAPAGQRGKDSRTPADHELVIRDERFCRDDKPPRWWHSGDPVATAWYNSVSASLPRGEAFFIDTLREFRDGLPPKLAEEVKTFIKQEINHTREHVAFNRLVSDHGYDVESIDKGIHEMLALTKEKPKEVNLAICITLEHFAACISDRLLSDPRYMRGADPEAARLWKWHALEEIEHKGLVADVWEFATRDWSAWRRYKTRAMVAALITRKYFRNRRKDAIGLMLQDGLTERQARWRLHKMLWLSPGMMTRMFFHWAVILLPGFHPWKYDNRHLLGLTESPYSRAALPAE
ncbi:MAG: metal-dependent hydrolase [Sphingomonadales bacterium]|nr:metal-dependent hydrolase [Sphingomonadales bacterium]MBD3773396.1 metal-dependent hydrolase [Paracoccaceae bacterium]